MSDTNTTNTNDQSSTIDSYDQRVIDASLYLGLGVAGLSILVCLIDIFFYVCIRKNKKLAHYVDRISIRLIIYVQAAVIPFAIAGIVSDAVTYPGFWCGASVFLEVVFSNLVFFLITCIAINLQLVFFNGIRTITGNYEKWFLGVSVILAIAFALPPAFKNIYGYEPIEESCWFVVLGDQGHAFYWEVQALYGPQGVCVIYCLIIIFALFIKLCINDRRLRNLGLLNSRIETSIRTSTSRSNRTTSTSMPLLSNSKQGMKDIKEMGNNTLIENSQNILVIKPTTPPTICSPEYSQSQCSRLLRSSGRTAAQHDHRNLSIIAWKILAYPIALVAYAIFDFGEDLGAFCTDSLNLANLIVVNLLGGAMGIIMGCLLLFLDPSFGTGVRMLFVHWGWTIFRPKNFSSKNALYDSESSPSPHAHYQSHRQVKAYEVNESRFGNEFPNTGSGKVSSLNMTNIESITSNKQSREVLDELRRMDLGLPDCRTSCIFDGKDKRESLSIPHKIKKEIEEITYMISDGTVKSSDGDSNALPQEVAITRPEQAYQSSFFDLEANHARHTSLPAQLMIVPKSSQIEIRMDPTL